MNGEWDTEDRKKENWRNIKRREKGGRGWGKEEDVKDALKKNNWKIRLFCPRMIK